MTKSRLIYLLLVASLFASMFACIRIGHFLGIDGMSDGGGLL